MAPSEISEQISCSLQPRKGGCPAIRRYITTPQDQMSHFVVYSPLMISGAMQQGVPTFQRITFRPTVLTPKSISLRVVSLSLVQKRIFSGLMSLCAIPQLCRQLTAQSSSFSTILSSFQENYSPASTWSQSQPPRHSSVTMQKCPQLWQKSYTFTILGWSKLLRIPISVSIFSSWLFSPLFFIIFIAQVLPLLICVARLTSPNAPFPTVPFCTIYSASIDLPPRSQSTLLEIGFSDSLFQHPILKLLKVMQIYDSRSFRTCQYYQMGVCITANNGQEVRRQQVQLQESSCSNVLSYAEMRNICSLFRTSFFLNGLNKNQMVAILKCFNLVRVQPGTYLFIKGQINDYLLYLESGVVQYEGTGENLPVGQLIGQMNLIRASSLHQKSGLVITSTIAWLLKKQVFQNNFQNFRQRQYPIIERMLKQSVAFGFLNNEEVVKLARKAYLTIHQQGQLLYKQGDPALTMGFLLYGQLNVQILGKKIGTLQIGMGFGQNCLKQGEKRTATLKVQQNSKILNFNREDLLSILGDKTERLFFYNKAMIALNRTLKLKYLNKIKKDRLIKNFAYQKLEVGSIFIEGGTKLNNIYFNYNATIVKEDNSIAVKPLQIFGESAIFNLTRQAQTLKVSKAGEIGIINCRKLLKIVGSIQNILKVSKCVNKNRNAWSSIQRLEDIRVIYTFSTRKEVSSFLCVEKIAGSQGFLLSIDKRLNHKISRQNLFAQMLLGRLSFQFLPIYFCTLKDKNYCILVFQYIAGQNLLQIAQKFRLKSAELSYIMAEAYLLLRALHSYQFVARSMALDLFCINQEGRLKLRDIQRCIKLSCKYDYRSKTKIGTPHYQPPQLIRGEGYSFASDYWSLGIFFYQLIVRQLPFGNQETDPERVYQLILNEQPKRLDYLHSRNKAASSLAQMLLEKDESKRSALVEHLPEQPYFKQIEWSQLEQAHQSPLVGCFNESLNSNKAELTLRQELDKLQD